MCVSTVWCKNLLKVLQDQFIKVKKYIYVIILIGNTKKFKFQIVIIPEAHPGMRPIVKWGLAERLLYCIEGVFLLEASRGLAERLLY